MRRIGYLELPERWATPWRRLVIDIGIAAACCGMAAVARFLSAFVLPAAAAPFAFAYPAILFATVLRGWRAGAMALALAVMGVWFAVFPGQFGYVALSSVQGASLILNAITGAMLVAIAEGVRIAAGRAERRRSETLASRELLLRELNHRIKNNFQMVAGLLEMQRRTAAEPATAQALESVIVRVHSLAQAHAALYAPSGDIQTIDFARYVEELCRSLSDSLLLTTIVQLRWACEPASMPTDRAAALGLVINELVTNAVKHAFPDGRSGVIEVIFGANGDGWRLTVKDDGVGVPKSSRPPSGIGRRLVDAFARQAGGSVTQGPLPGAVFHIDLPA